ncbi:MAG: glycerol-3-phosphate acyltransferase [Acidimicrobiaceae bacterium]|nr:glycerol-3-phosphate acyltransferase [Acidimicrobiaceae bacterium]
MVKGSFRTRGTTVRLLAAAGGGYLLGMVPSADIAARMNRRSDLRSSGTGNPGGMNAGHVLGRSWGAAVIAADIGKGVAAARLGRALAGDAGANLASTAAVGGHCFPLGRTGGKGVATSIGQVIGTFPVYLPLDAAVALTTSALPLKQRTRTATTVASITWVLTAAHWWWHGWRNPGGVKPTVSLPLAAAASSTIIALRFAAEAETVDAFNRQSSGHQDPDQTEQAPSDGATDRDRTRH